MAVNGKKQKNKIEENFEMIIFCIGKHKHANFYINNKGIASGKGDGSQIYINCPFLLLQRKKRRIQLKV